MSNPLFDISQYQSAATQSYNTDSYWDEPKLHPGLENSTAEPDGNAEHNSTKTPTMTENETTDSSHAKVEVVEELSIEEEADRQRLELKVERAWEEGARALQELRDRRLYRDRYKNFRRC